jgi:serine protease Do
VRYAYALTTALALSGAAAAMTLHQPAGAQTAQNEPGAIQAGTPRAGAPMSFADLVARLQPAVVNISTNQRVTVQQQNPFQGTPFEQFFGTPRGGGPRTEPAQSLGSGFLISADGYVVTNNHVVSAGTQGATVESITVTLSDRREYTAKLVGRDPSSDLAVLKIQGSNFPFVRFGDSRQTRVGDWVVAIGNPFGLSGTVSAGIVSAVNRVGLGPYDRFIQTDASINRGNSGGPMFDLQGNVIGINSQILSPTGGNVGIGFAIPAEQAKPIVDTLMRGETVTRGYLGIQIQPVSDDIAGALGVEKGKGEIVGRVESGQPGERAGLQQGDVVLALNGQEVSPDQTLTYMIARQKPGSRVTLDVVREGRRLQLNATVGTRPSDEELAAISGQGFDPEAEDGAPGPSASASATLGLAVQPLTPQIARALRIDQNTRGVVVTAVDQNSDAARKGMGRGVVITRINSTPINSAADIATAVRAARRAGRNQVLVYVIVQGFSRFVGIDIEPAR